MAAAMTELVTFLKYIGLVWSHYVSSANRSSSRHGSSGTAAAAIILDTMTKISCGVSFQIFCPLTIQNYINIRPCNNLSVMW